MPQLFKGYIAFFSPLNMNCIICIMYYYFQVNNPQFKFTSYRAVWYKQLSALSVSKTNIFSRLIKLKIN